MTIVGQLAAMVVLVRPLLFRVLQLLMPEAAEEARTAEEHLAVEV
jgi:hypothetical protein